jgi:nucleotide-binding universal stress UspA family protein
MSGIVVGIDGSGHSERALEWAAREAAVHHVPLTVVTVHEAVRGYYTSAPSNYPGDDERTEKMREAAQAETDKVLAGLGDSRPETVTVNAVHGFPVEEIIKAGKDADMIVLGQRGAGGFTRLVMGSVSSQVAQHADVPVVILPPKPYS